MDYGFFSLLPPLVAIVLAVITRKVVLPLAAGIATGAVLLSLGRVEFTSDLGTDGEVSVRFVAPSPWLSGTNSFIEFWPSKDKQVRGVSCRITMLSRDNVPVDKGVVVSFETQSGRETTVGEFLREFEKVINPDDFLVPTLEHGDPNTIIGGRFTTLQRLNFTPDWETFLVGESKIFLPQGGFIKACNNFYMSIRDAIFSISHLQVFIFTVLLGAMVGTLESGGGMRVLIQRISRRIKTRRGAQTFIATSGLAVFFDDYANTLLLGGTMRTTADRYGLSRQKLAYFVDSTAAPIAGLALISTWTAIEISYIADGLAVAGIEDKQAAFTMFLQSIPYRFYPWLSVVMVYCIALSQRDFGPMLRAEMDAVAASDTISKKDDENGKEHPHLWFAAVAPIVLCVVAVLAGLAITGKQALSQMSPPQSDEGLLVHIGQIFGNGDAYLALIAGGAIGLLSAILIHTGLGCTPSICFSGARRGARQMLPAIVILWLAWALSGMTEKDALNTGGYLASGVEYVVSPPFLPTVVFLVAAFTAFSTGTSWGTMAILTPLSIGLALEIDYSSGAAALGGPIALSTCGSVLAGAIFGDHCSPISDTTVLSSRSSGCDHIAHVRTQLPYALVVGAVSILFGTLPAAMGLSPWICLIIGSICLCLVVRLFGRFPAAGQSLEEETSRVAGQDQDHQ
ncbi:Na+/H+ antiporter NhaC family protein [Rhodopirellula sp.]|nr:Na+/H+ antiporter NhaC family protein [Rhodopirellula sp.]MDB4678919.1 Na+/H+ antiporter NhaC family protein [Rhodopirellula sp.]